MSQWPPRGFDPPASSLPAPLEHRGREQADRHHLPGCLGGTPSSLAGGDWPGCLGRPGAPPTLPIRATSKWLRARVLALAWPPASPFRSNYFHMLPGFEAQRLPEGRGRGQRLGRGQGGRACPSGGLLRWGVWVGGGVAPAGPPKAPLVPVAGGWLSRGSCCPTSPSTSGLCPVALCPQFLGHWAQTPWVFPVLGSDESQLLSELKGCGCCRVGRTGFGVVQLLASKGSQTSRTASSRSAWWAQPRGKGRAPVARLQDPHPACAGHSCQHDAATTKTLPTLTFLGELPFGGSPTAGALCPHEPHV